MPIEVTRILLFSLALSIVGFLLGIWLTYAILRAAIRDGIKDSGLVQTWSRTVAIQQASTSGLPDMRAER